MLYFFLPNVDSFFVLKKGGVKTPVPPPPPATALQPLNTSNCFITYNVIIRVFSLISQAILNRAAINVAE